jgi:hypothetical protein
VRQYPVTSVTWRYTQLKGKSCRTQLDRNLGHNHHLYQDNFYNSVKLAETLLDRNVRVCGTMRANRGIPRDLEGEGKCLNRGQSAFRRKGDVIVQVWKDKRFVRMISTIHDAQL